MYNFINGKSFLNAYYIFHSGKVTYLILYYDWSENIDLNMNRRGVRERHIETV